MASLGLVIISIGIAAMETLPNLNAHFKVSVLVHIFYRRTGCFKQLLSNGQDAVLIRGYG